MVFSIYDNFRNLKEKSNECLIKVVLFYMKGDGIINGIIGIINLVGIQTVKERRNIYKYAFCK